MGLFPRASSVSAEIILSPFTVCSRTFLSGRAHAGRHSPSQSSVPQSLPLCFPVGSHSWRHGASSMSRGALRFCRGLGQMGALREDEGRRESQAGRQASFRVA